MALNASESCPISSLEALWTTRSRFPRRISSAERIRRVMGRRIHPPVRYRKAADRAVAARSMMYICRCATSAWRRALRSIATMFSWFIRWMSSAVSLIRWKSGRSSEK